MNLEELITLLNSEGYWINNLAQDTSGAWKANIVMHTPTGLKYWEFAYGTSALEALTIAREKASYTLPGTKGIIAQANYIPGKRTRPDIDSLLEGL